MKKVLKIAMWTVACVFFVLLFGYITMILWNWLIPALFNGPVIHFWQALGLLLLSKILFGFGGRGHCGKGNYRGAHWKHGYYDRLASMSTEDRERFKAKLKEKWCSRDQGTSAGKSDASID
jgi:hypothetical protein